MQKYMMFYKTPCAKFHPLMEFIACSNPSFYFSASCTSGWRLSMSDLLQNSQEKKCHHFIDIIVWYLLRCPNHIIPRDLKSDIHVTSEGKCLGQNKKIILAPISLTGSGALNGKMLDLGLLKITLGFFSPICSQCRGL